MVCHRIHQFSTVSFHTVRRRLLSTSKPPIPDRIVSMEENQDLLQKIPLEDVRNFCFIAHVDHGKSSLSSRILEITGNMGRENQISALQTARGEDGDTSKRSNKSKQGLLRHMEEKEQISLLYETAMTCVARKVI